MSYKNHTVDNGGTTAGYDPAPNIPTSTAVGDRLIAIMQTSHNANVTITPPSGWTLEESGSMPINGMSGIASDSAVWIYSRVATQDDVDDIGTAPYTWTFSGSEEQVGIMILTDPATWGQFAIAASSGSAVTSQNAPSVTTTAADELVFHCAMKDAGVAFTGFPSGDATMASGIIGATSGAGSAYGIVREEYASTGATGTKAFTLTSEEAEGYTFSLVPDALEGITSVDSAYGTGADELDFDDADVDVIGLNFEATQGTGAVYISDASTLAGSVNEVEIDGAINTWANDNINLDFTGMTQTEIDDLHTLGPGARYIIVENDSADEYSIAITLHRPKAFALSASANITASGANTTAQLTAPSGKTTGDFGGGRIQDDENPTDTVDVGADEYREDEWCMEALPNSVESETYQFRVLIGGVVADTVTVTPEMTISSIATPNITDAGDELFELNETNIVITGTDFGATETGSAKVELVNNVVYASGTKVTQSVDTWSATSIQFDLVIGALTEIDLWLYVTDSVGTVSSGYPVQVYRTPTITNIEDEIFNASELSIVLDGTYLQSPQGTGKLEISDNAVYATGTKVSQTINSWNSTQINFDLEIGSIGQESMWMWVTNDLGRRSSSTAVTITGLPISDGLWKAQSFQGSITALGFNTTIFLIRDE